MNARGGVGTGNRVKVKVLREKFKAYGRELLYTGGKRTCPATIEINMEILNSTTYRSDITMIWYVWLSYTTPGYFYLEGL